ncbi:MAG: hypothetical protein KU29_00665 [Sulfurovum sp. FS06-10]|jgi:hypothetical protein|nr:MAG: hypothetical protein KU29_00665 [Sulfurovum sp. FS06-10]
MKFLFNLLTPIVILLMVIFSLLLLKERKTFDIRTLVQINPIPHTQELITQEKYVDADEYLSFFMQHDYVKNDPKAQELSNLIQEKRSNYSYKTDKFIEGIVQGKSDEDIGRISAIASDFLVIGDIRDLSIQGKNYFNHEEVDNTMVALSSLGLLATATTVYSLGATSPIKSSLSVLKYGKRINKIPSWLNQTIIREAKVASETKSLTKVNTLLTPVEKLYNNVGLNQTLNLLKQTKNAKELQGLVKFSTRFGKQSPMLLQTTQQTALTYAKAMPNVSSKNFIYASTYGERGLKGLSKMGESKFMQRVGFRANLIKTAYKGNFNSLITALLKYLPSSVLFGMAFLGLFYFIRKFFVLTKKLF